MLIDLRCGCLADLKGNNPILLHLLRALHDVLNLHFVGRECATLTPVASGAIYDEVVGKLWRRDTEVNIWSLWEVSSAAFIE